MSTRRTIAAATALLALGFGVAAQTPATRAARQPVPPSRPTAPVGPDLGVPATPAETAAADISVGPDGAGLPPGSGTPKQGAEVYAAKCVACHGADGANGINDRLVSGRGGRGTLTSPSPVKTIGSYWPYATTIFDYIRRAMPFQTPESLTNDQVYALTAYLLSENGIIGANDTMNAQTLPQVKMPNRNGFIDMSRQ
jgi:cytochrome c